MSSKGTELIVRYLSEQHREIGDGEAELRRSQSSVHAVRVATRRLRSTIRTFGPVFEPDAAAQLDGELAWLAELLGEVRDRQVQRARFAAALSGLPDEQVLGPVAADIEQQLLGEQLRHTQTLVAALDTARFRALTSDVARWAADPPLTRRVAAALLRELVTKSRKKTLRKLARAIHDDNDELLHSARKSAKRTRYAAELAKPVLRKQKDRRAAKTHESLQTVLGAHQDSVVAAELLRRLGARTAGEPGVNGFTYGLLFQRELDQAARSRRKAARWTP